MRRMFCCRRMRSALDCRPVRGLSFLSCTLFIFLLEASRYCSPFTFVIEALSIRRPYVSLSFIALSATRPAAELDLEHASSSPKPSGGLAMAAGHDHGFSRDKLS